MARDGNGNMGGWGGTIIPCLMRRENTLEWLRAFARIALTVASHWFVMPATAAGFRPFSFLSLTSLITDRTYWVIRWNTRSVSAREAGKTSGGQLPCEKP